MNGDFVYVRRTYECPECGGVFESIQLTITRPPRYCALCGADVEGTVQKIKQSKPVPRPKRPRDRSVSSGCVSRSVDSVYRGMEDAATSRMRDAAEVLGVSVESLSAMKMTDMKDNMREGDMAQAHIAADATKLTGDSGLVVMPGSGVKFNPFQQSQAAEAIGFTGKGPEPFAGNRARDMVTSLHAKTGFKTVAAGRINKK